MNRLIHFIVLTSILLLVHEVSVEAKPPVNWTTNKGFNFLGDFKRIGVGAIGVHRYKSDLYYTRVYYFPTEEGIIVQSVDGRWIRHDEFIRDPSFNASLAHMLDVYRPVLGAERNQEIDFDYLLEFIRKKRTLMTQLRTRNVWFYCRYVRFFDHDRAEDRTWPLGAFVGTPDEKKLVAEFDKFKRQTTVKQNANLSRDLFDAHIARLELRDGTIWAPFGADWMKAPMNRGGNVQRRVSWSLQKAQYRNQYLWILQNAR